MKDYWSFLLPLFASLTLSSTGSTRQARPVPGQHKPAVINNPADSVARRQRAVAFIKGLKKYPLESPQFRLENQPATLKQMDCLAAVLADKATFTQAELRVISREAAKKETRWSATEFGGLNLLESDTVEAIFKDRHKWWTYFHKHVGPDYNAFSLPIFIRNNTYCLFYTANYCGGLCAEGSLVLYKKSGTGWMLVKRYCEWVS